MRRPVAAKLTDVAPIRMPGTLPIEDVREGSNSHGTTRRSTGRWLTYGIVAVLLLAMVLHVAGSTDELASIRKLSAGIILITCLLQCASQLCLNASLLLPLKTRVLDLGFWELYLVRTGGFLVGSVVPIAGGLAVRLAYLKRRGLTYLDFTWATLVSNVLALAAAALLAVMATALLWLTAGPPAAAVLGIAGAVAGVSVAAVAVLELLPKLAPYPVFQRFPWLSDLRGLGTNRRLAASVFVLSLARHGLNFVTFGALYGALTGAPAGFLAGGVTYALTSPVRMVTITPGNLGIIEWTVAIVGRALSFDLTTGLIVAIAFRGVSLVGQAMGLVVGFCMSIRRTP